MVKIFPKYNIKNIYQLGNHFNIKCYKEELTTKHFLVLHYIYSSCENILNTEKILKAVYNLQKQIQPL